MLAPEKFQTILLLLKIMDIDVPPRELGAFDATALREAILGQVDVVFGISPEISVGAK